MVKSKILISIKIVLLLCIIFIFYKLIINNIYIKKYGRESDLSDEFRKIKLDIVYTWVDMCDEDWVRNEATISNKDEIDIQNTLDVCSEYSYKEIDYSLLYSIKNMKNIVGTIYVITDNQIPNLLIDPVNRSNGLVTKIDIKTYIIEGIIIKIVYHTDIIPENFRPTYNSNYIEAFLHKIPNLSKWFLYMNDDVFINKKASHDWFFVKDDIPRFIAYSASYTPSFIYNSLYKPISIITKGTHSFTIWNSNRLYNKVEKNKSIIQGRYLHTPKIINKKIFESLFEKYYFYIKNTFSPYRTTNNINLTFIYNLYMINNKLAVYSKDFIEYFINYTDNDSKNQIQYDKVTKFKPDFFVINDGFHNPGEILPEHIPKNLNDWLKFNLNS